MCLWDQCLEQGKDDKKERRWAATSKKISLERGTRNQSSTKTSGSTAGLRKVAKENIKVYITWKSQSTFAKIAISYFLHRHNLQLISSTHSLTVVVVFFSNVWG